MLDTSHCSGKGHGFSRSCCPTSYAAPKCSCRGHKNTGNCKPACNTFEVEAGTLGVGCKKNDLLYRYPGHLAVRHMRLELL